MDEEPVPHVLPHPVQCEDCTTREAEGAVRRVACGRYGDVCEAMDGGVDDYDDADRS